MRCAEGNYYCMCKLCSERLCKGRFAAEETSVHRALLWAGGNGTVIITQAFGLGYEDVTPSGLWRSENVHKSHNKVLGDNV